MTFRDRVKDALRATHRAPYSARREHVTAWAMQFAPKHRREVSTGC